ncbi:helix-turn-helix domain-containing protein [Acidaminobacter sp.]|uniref:helix-turn-helix domain-containing protein n=1 Tax=Acidaminobacter sp. TaxID=1872102 RepID=UPI0025BB1B93|nr:helix-turn-helix domain-containing protein [Acidaminobacter sp.]
MGSSIAALKCKQVLTEKTRQFSMATGVGCRAIFLDESEQSISPACNLCEILSEITQINVECGKSLLYSGRQSERFDGEYVFYCPVGLVNFASPVYSEGGLFAVVVGGPVLLNSHEEFVFEELIDKFLIKSKQIPLINNGIQHIPQIPAERVTALSHMLSAVCVSINGMDQVHYVKDETALGRDISKYLKYLNTMGGGEEAEAYPIEKERQLLAFISSGNKVQAQRLLDEILLYIASYSNHDFEIAKGRVLELVVLLSRAALEGGAGLEKIFGLKYKYLSQINDFKTVAELSAWLFHIMLHFIEQVFDQNDLKHPQVILKAVDFLQKNFQKKITLEEVAAYVNHSSSYFSTIFKSELKVSFNAYLNHLRIEQAKKLLLENEFTIVEISELVGYEDQSYFSRVFKKNTGTSPGKYRLRHGKIM